MSRIRIGNGRSAILLFVAQLTVTCLCGQGSSPGPGPLTPDSPVVLYQLTYLCDHLASTIAERNSADPQHAASRLSGARGFLGVSADGFERIAGVLSPAKRQLDGVLGAQAKFVAELKGGSSGASIDAALRDFEAQQTALLRGLPAKLRAVLSPADFAALQSFIARELVAKIHTGVINHARPK